MEVGDNIRKMSFRNSLKQGAVFRLKGDIPFESECYHVFVVLNYDVSTGEILFLVNGTSQVAKRWLALEDVRGIDARSTTVYMRAGSYGFLPKDTLFDCNSVHCVNIDALDLDNIEMITGEVLTEEDVERLVRAALASPVVERFVKRKIRGCEEG